jgi:hypothetical protein
MSISGSDMSFASSKFRASVIECLHAPDPVEFLSAQCMRAHYWRACASRIPDLLVIELRRSICRIGWGPKKMVVVMI